MKKPVQGLKVVTRLGFSSSHYSKDKLAEEIILKPLIHLACK